MYAHIECCAEGYDVIEWFLKIKNTTTWKPYPFYNFSCTDCEIGLSLDEHNQTLRVERAGSLYNGTFLCSVQNLTTRESIEHQTRLDVYDCTDRGRPLPIRPYNVYVDVGQNASFVCGGDFGCKDSGLTGVDWLVNDEPPEMLNSSKFRQKTITSSHNTVKKSWLTIIDVQPDDFHSNYTCWVFSDYGSQDFTVHLNQISKPSNTFVMPLETIISISTVLGGTLILIVILSPILYTQFGPQISLYFKSRMSCSSFIDKGDSKYHVFICHSDDNRVERDIAVSIKSELNSRRYDVACMTEDKILGGQCRLSAAVKLAEESAAAIFLNGDISEEVKNIIQTVKSVKSPKYITVVLLSQSDEQNCSKHEDFTGLYSLKWPNQKSKARHVEKFYCSLQLRLPLVRNLKENKSKLSNERERLLSTPSTTSANADGGHFDFSFVNDPDITRQSSHEIQQVETMNVVSDTQNDELLVNRDVSVEVHHIDRNTKDGSCDDNLPSARGSPTAVPRQGSEESGYHSLSPRFSPN
ncbi:hypothetical protein FSP39_016172 [Pinctada imbricata]|uniref:Immunoglobulin domain-containing protein n=1 Tax=Pinctada imbricata TaxID=66713 RepID=A0AA89C5J5_PINIB|nr:hypothetical protein FSP39_016172 [Pinctada imbricata]